jgi:hypothetical protein
MLTMMLRLGFDHVSESLVAAALAYAIDLDMRELVHALAPRRKPALHLETCADSLQAEPATLLRAIESGSSLRRGRVLAIGSRPFTAPCRRRGNGRGAAASRRAALTRCQNARRGRLHL